MYSEAAIRSLNDSFRKIVDEHINSAMTDMISRELNNLAPGRFYSPDDEKIHNPDEKQEVDIWDIL